MTGGIGLDFICMNPDAEYPADQVWKGSIRHIKKEGKTIEAEITGKGSRMMVVIGRYTYGNYICVPDWGIGSPLASLGDRFWNRGQLERHMSRPDAITISEALKVINEEGMV